MSLQDQFITECTQQKTMRIRVVPNAKTTEIAQKMDDGTWKIRLTAPAVAGKANTQLLRFLKKEYNITAAINGPQHHRTKHLHILDS